MKQVSKIFFFFLAATIFVACGDDDDKGGPSTKPTASMSTTYKDTLGNTTNWSATSVEAEQGIDGFTITGSTNNQTESFSLYISAATVGDHFDDATIIYTRLEDGNLIMYSSGSFGSDAYAMISVTEVDTVNKTISGTFSYLLTNPMNSNDYIYNSDLEPGKFTKIPYSTEVIGGGGEGTFNFDLNGTPKVANEASGIKFAGQIMLSANFGATDASLTMPGDIAPGTYDFGSTGSAVSMTYMMGSTSVYVSNSGSLVITSHNTATKTISGTFQCALTDLFSQEVLQATNGNFSITYF